MTKRFALFDLDGVLCPTQHIHYRAFNKALNAFDVDISFEYHNKFLEGLSTPGKLSFLEKHHLMPNISLMDFNLLKQRYTQDILENEIKPDLLLKQYLIDLVNSGLRVCVCSNARRASLDLTLKLLGVAEIFSFSISYEDVGAAKPAPDVYLDALERFKAQKDECVIIEDSEHGVSAAKAAKIDYILVKNGYKDLLGIDLKVPFNR